MQSVNTNALYNLSRNLENTFKDRISFNEVTSYDIIGLIDGKPFGITYIEGESLIVSCYSLNKEQMQEELMPIISTIVKGIPALCSYDIHVDGEYPMSNVEWSFKNPGSRIQKLMNDPAIRNFELDKRQNFKDYMEYLKIYGLYPGNLDVSKANNYSEIELYFAIDDKSSYIHRVSDAIRHGKMAPIDLTEDEYALEYLVNLTRKYGVDIKEPIFGSYLEPSESYLKWISFYDHHFKHVLTDRQYEALRLSLLLGIDTSFFMPKGNWQDWKMPVKAK